MRKFVIVIFFLGLVLNANSQPRIIVGQVKDELGLNPIPYAAIFLANDKRIKSTTDINGYYAIHVSNIDDTLICSHVGYKQVREKIEGNNLINFFLPVNDTNNHIIELTFNYKRKLNTGKFKDDDEERGCIFGRVEITASYPGGNEGISTFFMHKIKKVSNIEDSLKPGCIKLRLLITRKGTVSKVVLIKGIDAFIDDLVTKIGYEMLWRPAIQNGRIVETIQDVTMFFL